MAIRIVHNRRGVRELLTSAGVQADLARRAQSIASAAGPGMETDSEVGRNRARAVVFTATTEARLNEALNRSLTRAIDAAR